MGRGITKERVRVRTHSIGLLWCRRCSCSRTRENSTGFSESRRRGQDKGRHTFHNYITKADDWPGADAEALPEWDDTGAQKRYVPPIVDIVTRSQGKGRDICSRFTDWQRRGDRDRVARRWKTSDASARNAETRSRSTHCMRTLRAHSHAYSHLPTSHQPNNSMSLRSSKAEQHMSDVSL